MPRDDPKALAEAMLQLYQNYTDYDSMQIREDCIEMFSEASIVRQLEEIYGQLLED